MKKLLYTGLCYILAAILPQGCNKRCGEAERERRSFASPMLVLPQQERIRLGDTLTLHIEIPYSAVNLRNNQRLNIRNNDISAFGIDCRLITKTAAGQLQAEGRSQFTVITLQGSSRPYTASAILNNFAPGDSSFVFTARIVPLKKGLVNLVNYKAESSVNNGCGLHEFIPECISIPNNHHLYRNFAGFTGNADDTITPNHYYIWVD